MNHFLKITGTVRRQPILFRLFMASEPALRFTCFITTDGSAVTNRPILPTVSLTRTSYPCIELMPKLESLLSKSRSKLGCQPLDIPGKKGGIADIILI
jgi:hypothetical protein